jgi:hypothetical protein
MTSPASMFVIQTFSTLVILFLALVFTGTLEIVPAVHSISLGFGTSIVALLAAEYIMSSAPSAILDESIICESLTFFHLLLPIELMRSMSAFYGMIHLSSSLPHGSGADAPLEYKKS